MPNDSGDRLKVLLHESEQARDDERYMFSQYAVLLPVALTLIAAMATLFYQTCAVGSADCTPSRGLIAVPTWIYVVGPLLPIIFVSYVTLISTILTLRSYYMRVIDRQIHELTGQLEDKFPIPSWTHITLDASGPMRSSGPARLNWGLIFGVVPVMLLGCVYLALVKIPLVRYRVFALIVDGTLMMIPLTAGVLNVVGGSRLWDQALLALPKRLRRTDDGFPSQQPHGERSLSSYLALPRNQEELLKAFFIPISILVGITLSSQIPRSLGHIVGFFLIFEFLMYQARYLLNDVRDRKVDSSEELSKQRFPRSRIQEQYALKLAFGSFVVRCVLAILLVACILPVGNSIWIWHVAFLLSIFLVALPYETARSMCNAAEKAGSRGQATRWAWVAVGVVGLGYGLRSIVGLWLAGVDDKFALILVSLGASLFGSTFVALTWALESTRTSIENLAAGKSHLVLFRNAVDRTASSCNIDVGPAKKVLAGRQSLMAPWCAFAVFATAVLSLFALYLLRVHFSPSQYVLIVVAVIGVAGVTVVTPIKTASFLVLVSLSGAAVVLHFLSVRTAQSIIAALLTVLPLFTTCVFRNMCFDDLPGITNKIASAAASVMSSLYSWFVQER